MPKKKLIFTKKICTMTLWNKITAFCREKSMFPDKAKILLAVSGGPDSMAMLNYFARNAKNRKLSLVIAHVNHNLRGKASDGDAAFVQKKGQEYGIETVILSADVKKLRKRRATA